MKVACMIAAFLIFDVIFYLATPADYRHAYAATMIPGGGFWIYLKHNAEKDAK